MIETIGVKQEKLIRTALFLAVLSALVVLSSCAKKQKEAKQEEELVRTVKVSEARVEDVRRHIVAPCVLEGIEEVMLSAKASGPVVKQRVREGQDVVKGQVLLLIEDIKQRRQMQQAEAGLEAAEAGLESAERELKRLENLYEEGVVSSQQVDLATTQAEVARAQRRQALKALSLAMEMLGDTEVVSPIGGYLSELYVDEGEMAGAGMPVARIVNNRKVLIKIHVSDEEAANIAPDQAAEATLRALPGETFAAKVVRVSRAADPVTRTFEVELRIDDPGGRLKSGMMGEAKLDLGGSEMLAVPIDALLDREGVRSVFVVEEGRAMERVVSVGMISDEWVGVEAGIEEGERVVVFGIRGLSDGTKVDVVEKEEKDE
ncbi:MAG: efflux RND transporter periplasmic adaptor subunit [bacterium]